MSGLEVLRRPVGDFPVRHPPGRKTFDAITRKRKTTTAHPSRAHAGLNDPGSEIAGAHMAVVLIAEDDEDIAVILTRLLKRAGHTVLHEPDGLAALDSAVAHRPEVVLTDLGMPRMDGLELARAVRSHPDLTGTPIIMLSGQLHPGDSQPAEAGVCAVLLKPCPNDRVVATVGELAQRGAHQHGHDASDCPRRSAVTA
jgi:CheY-like chemotaxis protein